MSTVERMNELLDLARDHFGVTTDGELEAFIGADASTISRMRNNKHLPPQARAILIILNTVVPGPLVTGQLEAA